MTEFFPWEPDKYTLDIAEMDDQHQRLVALMNQLAKRDESGASKEELLTLLQQLGNFTVQHFREEEAYMLQMGYPQLDTHKKIHRELVGKLREHVQEFQSGSGRLGQQLLGFLKFWLSAHIKGIDRQYAQHAHRQSA